MGNLKQIKTRDSQDNIIVWYYSYQTLIGAYYGQWGKLLLNGKKFRRTTSKHKGMVANKAVEDFGITKDDILTVEHAGKTESACTRLSDGSQVWFYGTPSPFDDNKNYLEDI